MADEPTGKMMASNLDLFERLVRLDGKIDTFTEMMNFQRQTAQDHEARLRVLEQHENQFRGVQRFVPVVLAALAAIASIVAVLATFSGR